MWISPYWEFSEFQTIFSAHDCCYCSVISYLCDPTDCSMPGFPVFHYLSEFSQIHVRRVSDATQLSHPLPPTSPPALNLSQHQGLFQWVSSLHQVAKELELQHRPFQSGLIFFRTFWLDLLAVQGTLKSLLQHHNSKASVLWPTCGWWKVD